MSSAARSDLIPSGVNRERIFFWIRPADDDGFHADQIFARAAYSKAQDLQSYRSRELTDDAIRADLVERAVYSASRTRSEDSVRDPNAYIFTIFARLIDEQILRDIAITAAEDSDLDRLHRSLARSNPEAFDSPDGKILLAQILDAMPHDDRAAWKLRLLGYEVQEIANELSISANCLSTRLRRGVAEAVRRLRAPMRQNNVSNAKRPGLDRRGA
jgi:DNA-directed RNA polymerase specialized sigma24 family protein